MDSRKVAIITGAGSGVGRASSLALLKEGYNVVLAGRRLETLEETTAMSDAPSNALCVPTDVGDPNSIENLFATTHKEFGKLDLLFNNAGTGAPPILFEDLTFDQWKTVVDTNLTGSFLCAREAFRIMKSHAPRPNSAPYTATKHAITGLTKSISLDGRKYNISGSQIDIGNAGTPMTERMKNGVPQANGSVEVEPTFDVNHVADAVVTIANLPFETNIQFMTIMATKMPFIGRG